MIAGNGYYHWDIETGVFSLGIQRLALSHSLLPRQKLTCPLKGGNFKRSQILSSNIFEPLIFRGELLIFRGVKPESKAPILVKILARCRNTKPAKSSACWCSAILYRISDIQLQSKKNASPSDGCITQLHCEIPKVSLIWKKNFGEEMHCGHVWWRSCCWCLKSCRSWQVVYPLSHSLRDFIHLKRKNRLPLVLMAYIIDPGVGRCMSGTYLRFNHRFPTFNRSTSNSTSKIATTFLWSWQPRSCLGNQQNLSDSKSAKIGLVVK